MPTQTINLNNNNREEKYKKKFKKTKTEEVVINIKQQQPKQKTQKVQVEVTQKRQSSPVWQAIKFVFIIYIGLTIIIAPKQIISDAKTFGLFFAINEAIYFIAFLFIIYLAYKLFTKKS